MSLATPSLGRPLFPSPQLSLGSRHLVVAPLTIPGSRGRNPLKPIRLLLLTLAVAVAFSGCDLATEDPVAPESTTDPGAPAQWEQNLIVIEGAAFAKPDTTGLPEDSVESDDGDPGSEGWWLDEIHNQHYASFVSSSASASLPLWSGETYPAPGYAFQCPTKAWGVDWSVRSYQGQRIHFNMNPFMAVYYQGPAPSGAIGVPGGRFSAPNTWHSYSTDGEWRAWGGNLYGECHGQYRRTNLLFKVWVGFMRWYSFDGAIEATWGGGGYGPDGGWGAKFGSTYSGQGTAWGAALNAYLDHQQCTPGWEIWVDGIMACDGAE